MTDAGARKVHGCAARWAARRARMRSAPGAKPLGSMAGNAIVLPVRGVSRRHALLTLDPEGLTLEDLGSRNGTLVKGVRVQRTRLRAGDEIRLGPVRLRLEDVEPEDVSIAITVRTDAPASGLPDDETTATPIEETGATVGRTHPGTSAPRSRERQAIHIFHRDRRSRKNQFGNGPLHARCCGTE